MTSVISCYLTRATYAEAVSNVMETCPKCEIPLRGEPLRCPQCRRQVYILNAESGEYRITTFPVGLTLEGDPTDPKGRRLDSSPASGGRSNSEIDGDGEYRIELSGSLAAGRPAEPHVVKTLVAALQAGGAEVQLVPGHKDARGEDAIIEVGGQHVPVQVTTIPIDVWEPLARGEQVVLVGNRATAVSWIRDALVRKAASGRGVLLAVDASHVGVVVDKKTVETYLELYGDPHVEFDYEQIWVIGPTAKSSVRIG